jgi:hypothetical protein
MMQEKSAHKRALGLFMQEVNLVKQRFDKADDGSKKEDDKQKGENSAKRRVRSEFTNHKKWDFDRVRTFYPFSRHSPSAGHSPHKPYVITPVQAGYGKFG